jgi:hypothetical protein
VPVEAPVEAGIAVPLTPIDARHRDRARHAIRHGHTATARHCAIKTLARRPWSPDHWRLTFCVVRGRWPMKPTSAL